MSRCHAVTSLRSYKVCLFGQLIQVKVCTERPTTAACGLYCAIDLMEVLAQGSWLEESWVGDGLLRVFQARLSEVLIATHSGGSDMSSIHTRIAQMLAASCTADLGSRNSDSVVNTNCTMQILHQLYCSARRTTRCVAGLRLSLWVCNSWCLLTPQTSADHNPLLCTGLRTEPWPTWLVSGPWLLWGGSHWPHCLSGSALTSDDKDLRGHACMV